MPAPTPIEKVVEDYHGYLLKERSLSWRTRMTYLPLARRFLLSKFGSSDVDLSELRAADIINYVQQCAKGLSRTRAGLTRSTVRSFLQFARYRGDLVLDLAAHVPSVAGWSLSTLPKSLSARWSALLAVLAAQTSVAGITQSCCYWPAWPASAEVIALRLRILSGKRRITIRAR
jgi:site-specific recombinase XerC